MRNKLKTLAAIGVLPIAMMASSASAATIMGSFSLVSFGGSFVGGTAMTATGLDFGDAFGSAGNGYGTNGTALVGNAVGSFAGLNGAIATISDVALGATATPYMMNPFISIGNYAFNFTNAQLTRSSLGTSVNVTGMGTFTDGTASDTNTGTFSLAASSQNGSASSANFTFTSNASTTPAGAVPEPASWAMMILGMGAVGYAMRRRKAVTTRVQFV